MGPSDSPDQHRQMPTQRLLLGLTHWCVLYENCFIFSHLVLFLSVSNILFIPSTAFSSPCSVQTDQLTLPAKNFREQDSCEDKSSITS